VQPITLPSSWANFLHDFPEHAERQVVDSRVSATRGVSVVPQQPRSLLRQSFDTTQPEVAIPQPLRELYQQYRPTPLRRAHSFERWLGTRWRIYYKFEGANISGSHKLNTALAQAYYYSKASIKHLVTGTGAGQWGSAIAYACSLFGLTCTVFMVRSSLEQKPARRQMMELFGARVFASPSEETDVGRDSLAREGERVGSLGIATGEALSAARSDPDARFAVGSGESCVLLHQTVIGQEAIAQMDALGEFPEVVVACMGAGSNFAGIGMPFLRASRLRARPLRLLAVEPRACPKLTRGIYAYDRSDFSGTTPISRMYTLGGGYIAPPIYAGGLRYHGTSPFLSSLYAANGFDALAVDQVTALEAGLAFARTEGILPATESAHAVAGAVETVQRRPDEPGVILIGISGHGILDLEAYGRCMAGALDLGEPDEAGLAASLAQLRIYNETAHRALAGEHT
jgi:tryptophan synthase beta chain